MRRTLALTTTVLALGALAGPAVAHNSGLPAAPLDSRNLEFHNNVPTAVGNSMAPFERRQSDGSLRRYLVVANVGNGFDIVDITDPHEPTTVGRYLLGGPTSDPQNALLNSSLGNNWHAWVDVNPRRNIVVLSVEKMQAAAGGTITLRHEGRIGGVTFVDITDVTNPVHISDFWHSDLNSGPHTVRMIGDNCVYTSLNTVIINYTNALAPTHTFSPSFQGHEFYEDPNIPHRAYMGLTGGGAGFRIIDTTDCLKPTTIVQKNDPSITAAHEVYPAPDSSYVGIADFTSGQVDLECPGGGIHFYDISGKYVAGASLTSPRKMGVYYAPFNGAGQTVHVTGETEANYASCTMHSWQMQLERQIALGGLYAGGTWVLDPSHATLPGGLYTEWQEPAAVPPVQNPPAPRKTTWGNTLANNRDALDYVNATQWWPFESDSATEDLTKQVFVNGWARGLDTYTFTGTLPKKLSRLAVNASAAGGVVTGVLDRYAILTFTGFANKPLAGKELTVSAGGTSVTVTTGADGSFSADLGLAAGSHAVTVTWAGDDLFATNSAAKTVTA